VSIGLGVDRWRRRNGILDSGFRAAKTRAREFAIELSDIVWCRLAARRDSRRSAAVVSALWRSKDFLPADSLRAIVTQTSGVRYYPPPRRVIAAVLEGCSGHDGDAACSREAPAAVPHPATAKPALRAIWKRSPSDGCARWRADLACCFDLRRDARHRYYTGHALQPHGERGPRGARRRRADDTLLDRFAFAPKPQASARFLGNMKWTLSRSHHRRRAR